MQYKSQRDTVYSLLLEDVADINLYQNFARTTAIYPGAGTRSMEELSYLGLGLVNEAGEVAGKLKKYIRDGRLVDEEVLAELGDVLWYMVLIAEALGFDASDLIDMNAEKLQDRANRGVIGGSGDKR